MRELYCSITNQKATDPVTVAPKKRKLLSNHLHYCSPSPSSDHNSPGLLLLLFLVDLHLRCLVQFLMGITPDLFPLIC